MKKTKRILSAALAAVLLATAAAGCQKSEQGAANGKTVIVGAATDLKTLDTGYMYEVYGNMVSYSLYDMLFRIEGEDMSNPKPSLVTDKWTLDETGTIYTLPIREGVKFASGNPLTAEDVVWSIQRVMGLKDSSNQAHVAGIQSVEAKDDHTVVIQRLLHPGQQASQGERRFHRGGQGHRPGVSEQKLRRFRPLHPGELDAGK